MLNLDDLKAWLARDLPVPTKLLLVLSSFSEPRPLRAVLERASSCGLRLKQTTNPSMILSRLKGQAVRLDGGWEITASGRETLRQLGVGASGLSTHEVASDLREHLGRIDNLETRAFVAEAIGCLEARLHRSAVVMSWLAAVHVLKRHVVSNCLHKFNQEAARVDSRWKPAMTTDDLGRMKESDFLNRLSSISVIGKNVKEQLSARLDLRNACGHPNSLKLSHNTVASHVELLLLNVFDVFKT